MSADNYIFIDRKKEPIEIWVCQASRVSNNIKDQKISLLKKTKTLEEAFDWIKDNYDNTEYGICCELWWK